MVIIRKFNNEIFWGVPLTRTQKKLPFYFTFTLESETDSHIEKSTAVLSQVRLVDAKRLRRRIERLFGTLRDRLVKEMRLADIDDRVRANEFLEHTYLADHHERFAVPARQKGDAHRPLSAEMQKSCRRSFRFTLNAR